MGRGQSTAVAGTVSARDTFYRQTPAELEEYVRERIEESELPSDFKSIEVESDVFGAYLDEGLRKFYFDTTEPQSPTIEKTAAVRVTVKANKKDLMVNGRGHPSDAAYTLESELQTYLQRRLGLSVFESFNFNDPGDDPPTPIVQHSETQRSNTVSLVATLEYLG